MAKILVYGFKPFKRYKKNITEQLINQLPEHKQLHKCVFPVHFDQEQFLQAVEQVKPDYILGLGQCSRGKLIRIERKANNLMVDEKHGLNLPIAPDETERFVNWEVAPGLFSRLSYDAGDYVCNFSMYFYCDYAEKKGKHYAFLHIPRTILLSQGVRYLEQLLKPILAQ